jgi:Isopropylmalate/homocitrate/citramalate synthases
MRKIEKPFNVSFYNYEKEVLGNIELPSKVYIHDVTLRDGEQQAGIVFKKEEKVEIAQALMEAGVDRIEAGMPSVYEKDFEAVKEIAKIKQALRYMLLLGV